MDEEKILQALTDTQNRLTCKSSLTFGAACAGVVAGSGAGAVLAGQVLEKRKALNISKMITTLADTSTEIEALKYQQKQIASTGNLDLATNTGGDAKIKTRIAALESKMEELAKKINVEMSGTDKSKISKYLTSDKLKFSLNTLEKNVASVQRYNPKGAKAYHQLTNDLVLAVEKMVTSNQSQKIVEEQIAKKLTLRAAVSKTGKLLGSRLFQFLGGATFTGASLFVHSKNVACSSDTRFKYLTYDDDCNAVVEVSPNVVDFLMEDPVTQMDYLRKYPDACEFYISLATKVRLDDQSSEKALARVQNLSCGPSTVSFQVVDPSNISNIELKYDEKGIRKLSDYDKSEYLNFNADNTLSQYCEKLKCTSLQKGTSAKLAEKAINRFQNIKYAAAEAFKCCNESEYSCPINSVSKSGKEVSPSKPSSNAR